MWKGRIAPFLFPALIAMDSYRTEACDHLVMSKPRFFQPRLLVFMLAATLAAAMFFFSISLQEEPAAITHKVVLPKTPVPDLQMLATRLGGSNAITPEQIEEEKRVERQQVETAGEWLQDADPKRRATGAEQLSAYPTPEAEKLLVKALRDSSPEVRAAAAQSLDYFETMQDGTVKALLAALEDPDADVRLGAIGVLETQYQRQESRSPRAKKILAGLRRKAKSPRVAEQTQQAIQDFLRDQE